VVHYKVRNLVGNVEAGEDALGGAAWMEEVISEDLGIDLIIFVVAKDVLLVGSTVIDVIVETWIKLS
jgi:hypothetical protein